MHHIFTAAEKEHLFGLVLSHMEFERVDFSDADLRCAEFRHVSFVASDFSRADLRGANFIGCDLREARFDRAQFEFTRFDDSWLIGAQGLSEPMRDYVRERGGRLFLS